MQAFSAYSFYNLVSFFSKFIRVSTCACEKKRKFSAHLAPYACVLFSRAWKIMKKTSLLTFVRTNDAKNIMSWKSISVLQNSPSCTQAIMIVVSLMYECITYDLFSCMTSGKEIFWSCIFHFVIWKWLLSEMEIRRRFSSEKTRVLAVLSACSYKIEDFE